MRRGDSRLNNEGFTALTTSDSAATDSSDLSVQMLRPLNVHSEDKNNLQLLQDEMHLKLHYQANAVLCHYFISARCMDLMQQYMYTKRSLCKNSEIPKDPPPAATRKGFSCEQTHIYNGGHALSLILAAFND